MDLRIPDAVRDIDPLAQALQHADALRDALHRSELLTRSGSFTVQAPGLVLGLSSGLQALLGEPASGPAGSPPQLLDTVDWIPENERALVARFWRGATPGEPFAFQHGLRTFDGRLLQVLHHGLLQPGQGGQPPQGLAMLQDITDRRHAEQRILDLAYSCELTGLPNRQQAMGWLDQALHRAPVLVAGFSLLSIKAARSAEVTLSLGQGAGDSLTVALAGRLRQLVRDGERLAHLGAGEFALLLPGLGGAARVPMRCWRRCACRCWWVPPRSTRSAASASPCTRATDRTARPCCMPRWPPGARRRPPVAWRSSRMSRKRLNGAACRWNRPCAMPCRGAS
jgi:GGDEF domain-containing protein